MVFIILIEILAFFILFIPLIWEVNDDSSGDNNHLEDVAIRFAVAAIVAFGNVELHKLIIHHPVNWWLYFGSAFLLSLSFHFFIFDYWINFRYGYRDWFSYISVAIPGKDHSTFDDIGLWVKAGPWGRFSLRIVVLSLALILYF